MKVTFEQGPLSLELRKSILQDLAKRKVQDYIKKDMPKVVNQ